MNQSNVLMGALFVAFIIFITMRGKTQKYLNLLVGGGTSATAASDKADSSSGGGAGAASGAGGAGGVVGSTLGALGSAVGSVVSAFGGKAASGGDGSPSTAATLDPNATPAATFGTVMSQGAANMLDATSIGVDRLSGGYLGQLSRLVKGTGDAAGTFFQEIPAFLTDMPSLPDVGSALVGPGSNFQTYQTPYFGGGAP